MIGERLKSARLYRGWTQREVAAAVGVSAAAISKYERGQDMPGSAVLIRLAEAFDRSLDYFFRSVSVTLSEFQFRCRQLAQRERQQIAATTHEWLERYLLVESLIAEEQRTPFRPLDDEKRLALTSDDVEGVADYVRSAWGLGNNPIEDVVALFEDRGIKVGMIEAADGFDACVTWITESQSPVIVSKTGLPGDRQRFNLAHELGHIMLRVGPGLDAEKEAYRFAGAFLAPRQAVIQELGPHREEISPYELHLLKHKYGLSMMAWVHRAADLRIISENQRSEWRTVFKSQGWNGREPGDQLRAESPTRMNRLIVQLLTEGIITQSRAADLLGQPLAEFRQSVQDEHEDLLIELHS